MSNTAVAEAPQYPSAEQFQKLVAFVKQLAEEHNKLEARVIELERHEANRQRIENEQTNRAKKQQHTGNAKFQGRNAALEAEAS